MVLYHTSVGRPMARSKHRHNTNSACFNTDVVVIMVKYRVNGEGRTVVVCSAHLSYDSAEHPPSGEMVEVINNWERKPAPILVCDGYSHHVV
jgi:hypothetical protein